jgi:hypothetical protein
MIEQHYRAHTKLQSSYKQLCMHVLLVYVYCVLCACQIDKPARYMQRMWRSQWPTKLARRIKAAVKMQARFRGKRDRKKWRPILRVSTTDTSAYFCYHIYLVLPALVLREDICCRMTDKGHQCSVCSFKQCAV